MKKIKFFDEKIGYLYILPAVLIVTFVMLLPLLYTIYLSFTKNDIYTSTISFVGLRQYMQLFKDKIFLLAVKNTLIWTIASVFFQFLLGFVLANILHLSFIRFKSPLRILLMIPWVLPGIVSALVWQWSYHPDFGIINEVLKRIGLIQESINWTSSPDTALLSAIIVNVWKMVPFVMLFTEAALQGVPNELKEAARIDGASGWKTFTSITVPHIMPSLNTVILLLSIWTMNAFTFIYILTEGGPAHLSEILSMYIYRNAFQGYNFSFASAASVILFVLTAAITVLYNRFLIGDEKA